MSENIIYCYSGAGHCLDMAKTIAKKLGDTDIVMMRSYPVKTDAREAKRVGFVFSCMAGGLPGDMEMYIRDIQIAPDAYKFAVEQYAGYLGCGLRKIDEIVRLDYWNGVSNHSTAIWLMPHTLTFPPTTPEKAQRRVDCIGCGTCVQVCPRNNIQLVGSKPSFGTNCIGCLSCVQFCPKQAINIGKITEKRERFPNPKVKAADLTQKIIHID